MKEKAPDEPGAGLGLIPFFLVLAVFICVHLWLTSSPVFAETAAFEQVIQKNDRVLFVGDEFTQQMFYTRAVTTAVLAMRPDFDLRFFNGGRDGATSADAEAWVDELLGLTKPTVVFVCFGLDDRKSLAGGSTEAFERGLGKLVERIKHEPGVRVVIVLSPPPLDCADDSADRLCPDNKLLLKLTAAAQRVAAAKSVGYIDIFDYPRTAYIAARTKEGDPLSFGNGLPRDLGHIVIASEVLRSMGVTPGMLEPIGWSPLSPLRMRRVRQALAIRVKAPNLDASDRSQALYDSLERFDEQFFKLWRLAGKHHSAPSRDAAQAAADEAWAQVRAAAEPYRAHHGG